MSGEIKGHYEFENEDVPIAVRIMDLQCQNSVRAVSSYSFFILLKKPGKIF